MKVYIDLVFIINVFFDFLLLFTVNKILKRNINIKKLLLGSLLGGLSILLLLLKITKVELFFIKIIIAVLMCLVTFNYKNIRYTLKNIIYLYLGSIILGGFIYLINLEFSNYNKGIIFFNNGKSINILIILLISPLFILYYIKETKILKNNYNRYLDVLIYFKNNKNIHLNGYFDTGNNLKDPYLNKYIILVNYKKIKDYIGINNYILVPYKKLNTSDLLKCISINKIIVNNIEFKNILIGLSYDEILIDGVDCILNNNMEGLC